MLPMTFLDAPPPLRKTPACSGFLMKGQLVFQASLYMSFLEGNSLVVSVCETGSPVALTRLELCS